MTRKVKVKDTGNYRWATVTLTVGTIKVKEVERVDKHYQPHLGDGKSPRAITQHTIEAATLDAIRAADERARGILSAIENQEAP